MRKGTKIATMAKYLIENKKVTSIIASRLLNTDAPKDMIYKLRKRGFVIMTEKKPLFNNNGTYTVWTLRGVNWMKDPSFFASIGL